MGCIREYAALGVGSIVSPTVKAVCPMSCRAHSEDTMLTGVGTVLDIRGKTEQRVTEVISILRNASDPMSYDEIRLATGAKVGKDGVLRKGMPYDALLYITSTLIELGHVRRIEEASGPGRPRVYFEWVHSTSFRPGVAVLSSSA